jgi:hypothetical protein
MDACSLHFVEVNKNLPFQFFALSFHPLKRMSKNWAKFLEPQVFGRIERKTDA